MNNLYIYLVFSKTGTILSRILCLFSKTKYVHSSISLDSTFTKMYSFGRKNPANPFSGGFVVENINQGVYARFPGSKCKILQVKVTPEQYHALQQEIGVFLKDRQKYRYNFLGLFGILFHKPLKRKHHYFCSQFVSEVLLKSGIYHSNIPPELTKTYDLFSIENQTLYYKGFVNQCYPLEQLYNFTIKL